MPLNVMSESELQDLLLIDDSMIVHDDYSPLFQDLPAGFELLYNSPHTHTPDSPSTDITFYSPTTSLYDDMKQAIDNEIKNELSHHLQIDILGVPNTGAKSRVETQIKLCIQLMTGNDKKVTDWSHIRIGENMLARSRLRKNQQKSLDGSVATMVSDESSILQLEAKVVCASNTDHPIRMCVGCVRREKKRAERTKDGKQKNESISTDKELEYERNRILLFNCSPMINFSSGDAILPTRITCYCRHHNEKIGFRICFVMKNDKGNIIATGVSPPIMITDDHKSSKQKSNRKRSREVEDSFNSRPNTPAASRRNSTSTDDSSSPSEDLLVETLVDNKEEQVEKDKEPTERLNCSILNDNNINLYDTNLFAMDETWPFNRRRRTTMGYTSSDILGVIPQLDRLVPAQGPTYGGIEVTLLGSGFYRGLTCLFGEHPATTAYWNSSTMVCLLPPATQTGAVVVSFREHPLVIEGQDVVLFTYYDASDQALLELALQVVGLKSTGILQDAKSVAMGIVQGDEQYSNNNSSTRSQQPQQHNIQQALIDTLENSVVCLDLTLTNENGHSLLHLAVILQNEELVKSLVCNCLPEKKKSFLNLQDKNEMTALHFACQYQSMDMIRTLLHLGSNPSIETTKFNLNISEAIQDLFDLYSTKRKPLSRRSSVKGHMMHRFHSLSHNNSHNENKESTDHTPSMESDGLGFIRKKIDRRLYLFWLPVLILAIGLLGVQMIVKQPKFLKPILDGLPNRHSISLSA